MTTLLKQLGDDWHKPHPYEPLIRKVLPSTRYLTEIEDSLCSVYVAEHNDFNIYKTQSNHTVYDRDIDAWTDRKKKIQEEVKREEEALEKLAKKFAELQKFIDPTLVEEEEEDEEEEDVILPVERGKQRGPQVNKPAVKNKKQEANRLAKQANLTKANMASCQEKLMSLQKETEEIETKVEYYGHYRYASLGFSRSMKRLVQSYEQTKDIETLVKELADLHSYYDMMRRRYVPKGTCSGSRVTTDGLCETHLLPLRPAIYSSTGMTVSSRCPLYPV